MLSTIWGLLLGILLAAVLTVFYGERLNTLLRDAVPQPLATSQALEPAPVAPAGTGEPPGEETSRRPQQVAPVEVAAPAESPQSPERDTDTDALAAVPAPATPQPSGDAGLSRKWADYAARADTLSPQGEFRWRECFVRAAATHGVPESLLLALASGESGFDPAARSASDAVGLMQIRWPQTSRHLGITREADLYDPCTNVAAGARYVAELTGRYGNDLHRAVAAYNYGPGRIDDGPLPDGARWYSQYIYQHLQRVLGRPHVASSELLPAAAAGEGGFEVLMSFNQAFRARDFIAFLQAQEPSLRLAQRSEALGRHEVVMLYDNPRQRRAALDAIGRSGIATAAD